jgi:cell division protein FtsL
MASSQLIGLVIFVPILLVALSVILTKKADRDIVAERKRLITRNAWHASIGRPYRR